MVDLVLVLDHWGSQATYSPADFNNDGFVNAFDLAAILSNWNQFCVSSAGANVTITDPESPIFGAAVEISAEALIGIVRVDPFFVSISHQVSGKGKSQNTREVCL